MSTSTELVDKMEGVENLCSWNYRSGLILEENDMEKFIKVEISEPDDAAENSKHQKDTIMAKRTIANSIVRSQLFILNTRGNNDEGSSQFSMVFCHTYNIYVISLSLAYIFIVISMLFRHNLPRCCFAHTTFAS
jgi:hypothetical protein